MIIALIGKVLLEVGMLQPFTIKIAVNGYYTCYELIVIVNYLINCKADSSESSLLVNNIDLTNSQLHKTLNRSFTDLITRDTNRPQFAILGLKKKNH